MKSSFDHLINLMLFSFISFFFRPIIFEHEIKISEIFQSSINAQIRKFFMWNQLQIAIKIKKKFNQSNQTDEKEGHVENQSIFINLMWRICLQWRIAFSDPEPAGPWSGPLSVDRRLSCSRKCYPINIDQYRSISFSFFLSLLIKSKIIVALILLTQDGVNCFKD